jgi:hypothetical protein
MLVKQIYKDFHDEEQKILNKQLACGFQSKRNLVLPFALCNFVVARVSGAKTNKLPQGPHKTVMRLSAF